MEKDNIRVEGHKGTWYVIDEHQVGDKTFYLLEHEKYGDMAANVIIDENGALIAEDVWDGFDDELFCDFLANGCSFW